MIRISKLSDYGIVLLSFFAREPGRTVKNAKELAERAGMPVPTASKILKALSRASLLESLRGVRGGYRLARDPAQISVAEVIVAIEGPIALMECSHESAHLCALEPRCPLRPNWPAIYRAVRSALEGLKLSELALPPGASEPSAERRAP